MPPDLRQILVICGPSGVGKSTILKQLLMEYPKHFGFSVSHTTRAPRSGEVDGTHYHFTTQEKMRESIKLGHFLEWTTYSGNLYGTSISSVEKVWSQNKVCVLDIEMEGVRQIKQKKLSTILVFIKPPSLESLQKRLQDRGTETSDSLRRRLSVAAKEIEFGESPGIFDKILVNNDAKQCYNELKKFLCQQINVINQIK